MQREAEAGGRPRRPGRASSRRRPAAAAADDARRRRRQRSHGPAVAAAWRRPRPGPAPARARVHPAGVVPRRHRRERGDDPGRRRRIAIAAAEPGVAFDCSGLTMWAWAPGRRGPPAPVAPRRPAACRTSRRRPRSPATSDLLLQPDQPRRHLPRRRADGARGEHRQRGHRGRRCNWGNVDRRRPARLTPSPAVPRHEYRCRLRARSGATSVLDGLDLDRRRAVARSQRRRRRRPVPGRAHRRRPLEPDVRRHRRRRPAARRAPPAARPRAGHRPRRRPRVPHHLRPRADHRPRRPARSPCAPTSPSTARRST